VRVSYDQKPYRRALMETYGARCVASPSNRDRVWPRRAGPAPDHPGSLGIAISEAVEVAAKNDDTKYALGSVLNHVLLHQTIIGLEAMEQMHMADAWPDVLVGCTGGGSNFAGLAFPFIGHKPARRRHAARGGGRARGLPQPDARQVRLRLRRYGALTPLTKMHTLGSTFTPPGFHAGGLRYHGMAPLVSHVKELGLLDAVAYTQGECFAAGVQFARAEGIVPAPEANHAIKGAIEEALRCKREGKAETILFNLSGHGHFDMGAYQAYFTGQLKDEAYDEKELAQALSGLPAVPA
jgi:tryptophan synthase beta chain